MPQPDQPITFEALIEKHPEMDVSFITFPFSVPEVFGVKGQVKVKVEIKDYVFQGSLAPMGTGCHVLGIRKELRKAMNLTFGEKVLVKLEQDLEPRKVNIPEDLSEALNQEPELKTRFEKLAYTHQREYVNHVEEAKKPETREKRILKTLEMLRKK